MIFRFVFQNSGLSRFHSTDLDDMRRAIGSDDENGPDGGSPHVRPQTRVAPRAA